MVNAVRSRIADIAEKGASLSTRALRSASLAVGCEYVGSVSLKTVISRFEPGIEEKYWAAMLW